MIAPGPIGGRQRRGQGKAGGRYDENLHRSDDNTIRVSRRAFLAGGALWSAPKEIRLGEARFRVVRNGRSGRRFIHIHGNEATARAVLEAHVREHAGTAFFIESDTRNVPCAGGLLDPNRMFSREGSERNLRRLNPKWTEEQVRRAADVLDRDRDRFLRAILPPRGGLLFALHNNSEGYSIRDEIATGDRVSLPAHHLAHEFFLCTDPRDFETLAGSPYNVVLQQTALGAEDGSLSRLAARRRVRYVNLECALGKEAEQTEMVRWADQHLA